MEISYTILSLAFRFYSRSLQFPFDELTHEYQHLFREIEKQVDSELEEEIAVSILDVINHYQGEEMSALQGEYSRIFAFKEGDVPLVPLFGKDFLPPSKRDYLIDLLYESMMPFDKEPEVDTVQNILEYFSLLIEEEDEAGMDDFFHEIIEPVIPAFCSHLYQGTVLNFYKELAQGLNALVQQLRPPENE